MDRCCTSRGTETQQLFPSQSDGLPLIVHEYFTLSQMAAFQSAYNSSRTGPDDQIIKVYGQTSHWRQLKRIKLLPYIMEVLTDIKFVLWWDCLIISRSVHFIGMQYSVYCLPIYFNGHHFHPFESFWCHKVVWSKPSFFKEKNPAGRIFPVPLWSCQFDLWFIKSNLVKNEARQISWGHKSTLEYKQSQNRKSWKCLSSIPWMKPKCSRFDYCNVLLEN